MGEALLEVCQQSGWTIVDDTVLEPPRYWWDAEPRYRTFMAGPVVSGDIVFGLMTLDALEPGELREVPPVLVKLLADLLGTALTL